jgi:hypothetical protein
MKIVLQKYPLCDKVSFKIPENTADLLHGYVKNNFVQPSERLACECSSCVQVSEEEIIFIPLRQACSSG